METLQYLCLKLSPKSCENIHLSETDYNNCIYFYNMLLIILMNIILLAIDYFHIKKGI